MNKNGSYFGHDGGRYDNIWELNASNNRYEQMNQLIKEQQITNTKYEQLIKEQQIANGTYKEETDILVELITYILLLPFKLLFGLGKSVSSNTHEEPEKHNENETEEELKARLTKQGITEEEYEEAKEKQKKFFEEMRHRHSSN